MTEEKPAPRSDSGPLIPESKRKIVAVTIVVVLVVSSIGVFVWYQYFRDWTVEDLRAAVINDPTPDSPGFKHSLAGKTVTVEGKVTDITFFGTTQGEMRFVELDGFTEIMLIFWEDPSFEVGDRIEKKVTFEWSVCNDERHVYSPQLSFPCASALAGISLQAEALAYVYGLELIQQEQPDGSMRIMVEDVDEPILLSSANCSLRVGRGSWMGEYMDTLGWYERNNESDYIRNLTQSVGPNGTLSFTDANSDGYLDGGDYFSIEDLRRPDTESGAYTFLFLVQWREGLPMHSYSDVWISMSYIWMNHKGAVRTLYWSYPSSPGIHLEGSPSSEGFEFEITKTRYFRDVSWDDVQIQISDGTNFASWNVSAAALHTGSPTEIALPSVSLGGLSVAANVSDQLGDGLVNASDSFTLRTIGAIGFSNTSVYTADLIFNETHERSGSCAFAPGSIPISNMTASVLPDGLKFVCGPAHTGYNMTYVSIAAKWDDIDIVLSDGNETIHWSPDGAMLRAGAICTQSFATLELSNITLYCNVTDLEGNGYINRGDHIDIRAAGPDRLLQSEEYSITIAYKPYSGELFTYTFRG